MDEKLCPREKVNSCLTNLNQNNSKTYIEMLISPATDIITKRAILAKHEHELQKSSRFYGIHKSDMAR